MVEHVLGLEPLPAAELPPVKVSHAEKERRNLAAAAQYRKRTGNLVVGRQHREELVLDDGSKVEVSLGLFIANSRLRRATIPAERATRLTELGMSGSKAASRAWARDDKRLTRRPGPCRVYTPTRQGYRRNLGGCQGNPHNLQLLDLPGDPAVFTSSTISSKHSNLHLLAGCELYFRTERSEEAAVLNLDLRHGFYIPPIPGHGSK
ncbi:helicase associated domain-containing protein [Kitasatospora sp. NPDC088783]|uniref:helicase associated domain-containing protein n=1 Tax=Kitasatospora sp. NPDC088783 TaxID=3364077 RepID=UPI0038296722